MGCSNPLGQHTVLGQEGSDSKSHTEKDAGRGDGRVGHPAGFPLVISRRPKIKPRQAESCHYSLTGRKVVFSVWS